jgi:hypothetical protein
MEGRYGKANRIWVMDRGMVSEENMGLLTKEGRRYILAHTRKQLQQLAKYATKSIHKWPSFKCGIGLADSIYHKPKEGPIFLKVILDKSDSSYI